MEITPIIISLAMFILMLYLNYITGMAHTRMVLLTKGKLQKELRKTPPLNFFNNKLESMIKKENKTVREAHKKSRNLARLTVTLTAIWAFYTAYIIFF